jgi:hypothetical protein
MELSQLIITRLCSSDASFALSVAFKRAAMASMSLQQVFDALRDRPELAGLDLNHQWLEYVRAICNAGEAYDRILSNGLLEMSYLPSAINLPCLGFCTGMRHKFDRIVLVSIPRPRVESAPNFANRSGNTGIQ